MLSICYSYAMHTLSSCYRIFLSTCYQFAITMMGPRPPARNYRWTSNVLLMRYQFYPMRYQFGIATSRCRNLATCYQCATYLPSMTNACAINMPCYHYAILMLPTRYLGYLDHLVLPTQSIACYKSNIDMLSKRCQFAIPMLLIFSQCAIDEILICYMYAVKTLSMQCP